jgi:hypothetical protein
MDCLQHSIKPYKTKHSPSNCKQQPLKCHGTDNLYNPDY